MSTLYLPTAGAGNDQVVPRPRRTDAIGAALRGLYGSSPALPPDLARLIERLHRTR